MFLRICYLILLALLGVAGCDLKVENNNADIKLEKESNQSVIESNGEDLNSLLGKRGRIEIKDEKTIQELNELIEHGVKKIFDKADLNIQYTRPKYNTMFIAELKENKIPHTVILVEGREAIQVKLKDKERWGPIKSKITDTFMQELIDEIRITHPELLPAINKITFVKADT